MADDVVEDAAPPRPFRRSSAPARWRGSRPGWRCWACRWPTRMMGCCSAGWTSSRSRASRRLSSAGASPLLDRVWTPAEQRYCRGRMPELAARFAAKEAVSKTLGTGIRGIRWREMEILPDRRGKPLVFLHGGARGAGRGDPPDALGDQPDAWARPGDGVCRRFRRSGGRRLRASGVATNTEAARPAPAGDGGGDAGHRGPAAASAANPAPVLMDRAARADAPAVVVERLGGVRGQRILVLVGPGNNGGDGLWTGGCTCASAARRSVAIAGTACGRRRQRRADAPAAAVRAAGIPLLEPKAERGTPAQAPAGRRCGRGRRLLGLG